MGLLGSAINWWYGAPSQAENDALDRKIAEQNQIAIDKGKWDAYEYGIVQDNYSNMLNQGYDLAGQTEDAFYEGLEEGYNNVLSAPGKAVGWTADGLWKLISGILKNIPIWLWLVAAIALFFWMGGLALLRGRLARR